MENGIAHRLTQPASPTTTGKVERFHQTLRRELLDDCGAFESLEEAQAALDVWVQEYNCVRPHQALDMQSPTDRFTPVPEQERDVLGLKIPGVLVLVPQQRTAPAAVPDPVEAAPAPASLPLAVQVDEGGPVEFERVVPASGNLQVAGKQFWLGPSRSGLTVTFWADTSVVILGVPDVVIDSIMGWEPGGAARMRARYMHVTGTMLRKVAQQVGDVLWVLPGTGTDGQEETN